MKELEFRRYALSESQRLIWTGQLLKPKSAMYNMAFAFSLDQNIDIEIFRQAFRLLIKKSDIMRMQLVAESALPQLIFPTQIGYDFPEIDCTKTSKTANAWMEEQVRQSFDLNGVLFKTALLKTTSGYIWYINQHHLITDGWSISNQYQALSKLYTALISGENTDDIALNSYANYLESLPIPEHEVSKNYWAEKLKKLQEPALFYGKSNNQLSETTNRKFLKLPAKTIAKLEHLAQDKEMRTWTKSQTMYTLFCTVFSVLIHRITNEPKVSFGTPAHGRNQRAWTNTIGLFIKIFPLSVFVSETETFLTLYRKVRNEINAFLKYSQKAESSAKLNQSFRALLNYINAPIQQKDTIPAKIKWLDTEQTDPNHHLKLQIYDFEGTGISVISFDFNTTVFSSSMQDEIVRHYQDILELFIEDKNQPICAISKEEQARIASFNETEKNYRTQITILELFEEQVLRTPNAIAIVFEEQSLNYRELDARANQVGHFLQSKGVGEEDLITICVHRSLEMMIALLGIIKAGAAYVPIDPTYPEARIRYIQTHSKAKYTLTTAQHIPLFESKDCILLDDEAIWTTSNTKPKTRLHPQNLMYVIYTSGSTGQPKGVMNQHDGVINQLLWAQDTYQLQAGKDVVIQKTNYCFDVSVWELFWPIISGVKLVFAKPEGHKDSLYLKKLIEQYQVTTIHFVPPMLEVFLLSVQAEDCPSLKRVLCSGEALKLTQVNEFKRLLPQVELHNLYGPTEAAIEVSAIRILPNNNPIRQVTIGRPVANTKLYILDQELRPCGIGMPGEIHISGIQVARAYYDNPGLTRSSFIPNPYKKGEYGRLYKTGDLGYWLPDGTIAFLGRKDFQVKVRGFRIELGEIEAALSQRTEIEQAVVLAHTSTTGTSQLVAYFTASKVMEQSDLAQQLQKLLPDYMIPTFFVQLEAIPLNFNGKIDRKALAAIPLEDNKQHTTPTNDFEVMILDIWEAVLQVKMGIHDSFFAIGGDSLTGIKVMLRLNEVFELELPVVSIFQYPTIASLAVYVESVIVQLLEEMGEI